MSSGSNKKTEPWRIVIFVLAVLYIVFLWIRKDIGSIYAGLPREEMIPLIATTVGVSLVKVGAITGGILLIRRILGRIRNK